MSSRYFSKIRHLTASHKDRLIPALLLLMSCLVYLTYLNLPQSMFWDENYHIASAQKHIDGVMYMEPHPPLGKMLIGLSEAAFSLNDDRDMSPLLKTDYIKGADVPEGMEYLGFRFPSAFLMALAVVFFYQLLLILTKSRGVAFVFSLYLIFDNALVVHSRAAMLEGIQLFFAILAIWYFARTAFQSATVRIRDYAIVGLIVGLVVAVKVNGLVLSLLFGMLYWLERPADFSAASLVAACRRLFIAGFAFFGTMAAVVLLIFYVHIGMGQQVIEGRTYKASPEYLQSLKENGSWSLTTFSVGIKDHYRYQSEYADGVPRLKPCSPGENGSLWVKWPFGGKAINYRWSKDVIGGETTVFYSYLAGNPFVWLSVVAGIVFSVSLIIGRFVFDAPVKDNRLFLGIVYFTGLYVSYLAAISQIDRVMYMYHYFVPLTFGIVNLALVFSYVFKTSIESNATILKINLALIALLTVGLFAFFAPLTYSIGITEAQFDLRNWFGIWDMEPIR